MPEIPANRRRRLRFWLGITVIALLLLALPVLYLGSSWRLEAELARLRDAKVLVDYEALAPKVPPGRRNAADIYLQAFQAMCLQDADERRSLVLPPYRGNIASVPISDWDPALLQLAHRTVTSAEASMELLTQASRIPDCQFALDWETDPLHCRTIVPFDAVLLSSALLTLRMRLSAHDGRGEAALNDYGTALRVAAHLSQGMGENDHTVSWFYSGPTSALQFVLSGYDPSPARCRELFDRLAAVDLVLTAVRKQQFSLLSELALFDEVRAGRVPPRQFGLGATSRPTWRDRLYSSYGTIARPVLDQDEIAALRVMEQFVLAASEPWPKCQETAARAYEQAELLPPYRSTITKQQFGEGRVMLLSASGPLSLAPPRFSLSAQLGNAQIALALKAYKAQHGRYPVDLTALKKDGWQLPLDPFTGKPYRYRRDNQGFLVYSLGEDMKDQGGQKGSASSGTTYDLQSRSGWGRCGDNGREAPPVGRPTTSPSAASADPMPSRRLTLVLLLALAAVALGVVRRSPPSLRRPLRVTAHLQPKLPDHPPVTAPRVVLVRKAARVLGLYVNGRLAGAYPIALGPSPEGPKQREGDGRTPEGEYYVCTRNPNSRFHLFLGLSYPNAQDAEAGRRAGVITEAQHRALLSASAAHRQPPWDTPLGGEVGLHGNGASSDWTLGCLALEDEDIAALWSTLKLGDPVVIEP
jgi:hypothetical protein